MMSKVSRRHAMAAAAAAVAAPWGGHAHAAIGERLARASARIDGAAWPAIDKRFFGIHVHLLALHPGQTNKRITPWPSVPFGSIRLWDSGTQWAEINPAPGQWEFRRFDAYVRSAQAHNASVVYTLGMTPAWASARPDEPSSYGPGRAAEPRRIADWETYVRQVAQRYRGRIEAYEIWNEPKLMDFGNDATARGKSFFTGTTADLVALTRAARDIIRAEDPNAKIVAPGFINGPQRLKAYLQAGGAELVDVVAYHFYAGNSAQLVDQIDDVREVMRGAGIGRLPLWNSEASVGTKAATVSSNPTPEERRNQTLVADRLAQFLCTLAACGVGRYYYHAWDNGVSGLVAPDGTLLPSARAIEQVEDWLIGAKPVSAVAFGRDAVRLEFERGGERSVIAWSEHDGDQDVDVTPGWRAEAAHALLGEAGQAPSSQGGRSRVSMGWAPTRLKLVRENAR